MMHTWVEGVSSGAPLPSTQQRASLHARKIYNERNCLPSYICTRERAAVGARARGVNIREGCFRLCFVLFDQRRVPYEGESGPSGADSLRDVSTRSVHVVTTVFGLFPLTWSKGRPCVFSGCGGHR